MFVSLNTAPILRRHRRGTRAARTAATSVATAASTTDSASSTSSAAALPHAIPCDNYFELFPEEVGAVGNVEVTDAAEARQWQLVGRLVTPTEAETEGGCVKVLLDGPSAVAYYRITDSDDEVYGRAAYLPQPAKSTKTTFDALKVEPSVFSDSCSDACSAEDENDASSPCCSPCVSTTSMRCVYPSQSRAK